MSQIQNPHPPGSPAWAAIEQRIRMEAIRDKVVGVHKKVAYTDAKMLAMVLGRKVRKAAN
jgi:hypothetical protein